ncbi:MAG: LysR family transcriptional regulator [Pseudomonadota bacterium]
MYSVTDLETFMAIVERGGISAAAEALGLAPATVSHRLSKLENALRVKLFHRDSRHFRLSSDGRVYLERLGPALDALRAAESAVRPGTDMLRGSLRITLPPWVLATSVMPRLPRFTARHPDLHLDFLATDRFVNLADDGVDAAIRVGALPDGSLLARKLADNQRILCAAPSYLDRSGRPKTATDVADRAWVCLPWQRQWRLHTAHGEIKSFSGANRITVSSADSLTDAAIAGLGLVVKSRLAVAEHLEANRLEEAAPGVLAEADAPIWFLRAPHAVRSARVEGFYAFMRDVMRSDGDGDGDGDGDNDNAKPFTSSDR